MPAVDISAAAGPSLHGFLVVDKPAGWTSHDVVARARRLTGQRRIGHAGTLDPAATGVLPLAVGSATRVLEYLAGASKTYLADVTFGVETDSFDGDGRITTMRDASSLTRVDVEYLLQPFLGAISQIPPMHSAIKIGGRRLYELARQGEEIERPPRGVVISTLDLIDWQPPVATLLVDCSKGTYIRSLARDLGAASGAGAYLSNLVRLRSGPFTLCGAITLGDLAASALPWAWTSLAVHPDAVLEEWPALLLDAADATAWSTGLALPAAGDASGMCRAYDTGGSWLGIGTADEVANLWRPAKVIESAA